MNVNEGFDELQQAADAHIDAVREARRRRDVFRTALPTAEDVLEVVPTGVDGSAVTTPASGALASAGTRIVFLPSP